MGTLDKILKLIEERGITDREFIKAIGAKDKNLVLNWRNGVTKSYLKYMPQIAQYFEVSTDYLLGLKDE